MASSTLGYFGVSGSTQGDVFVIDASGRVGVATATPAYALDVWGSLAVGTTTIPAFFVNSDTGNVGIGTTSPASLLDIFSDGSSASSLFRIATGTTEALFVDGAGNVGIGTTDPGRKLDVSDASNPQFRLTQTDASIYTEFKVAPTTGDLTISLYPSASANDIILNMPGGSIGANLWVCEGDACPSLTLSTGGNLVVEREVFATGYRRISCPEGMIEVPPSPQDGMNGFCVDKYNAKSVNGIATSQAAGTPWVSITQYNARAECIRAGKHLITEKEWQSIAHNIERVGWNWEGGVAGTNQMSDGHSDGIPDNSLAASTDDDPCSGTGQTCSETAWNSQRRTYKLSNGQYIWDFGGNVWEWVDQVNQDEYPVYNSPTDGWVPCSTGGDGICGNTLTTNDQWYRGGTFATRGFLRGGYWCNGANSGAFTLALGHPPTGVAAYIGFRCAR